MYRDYLDDIISSYRTAAAEASIPQRLIQPTPGRIKDECLSVCKTRFQKTDLRTLAAFFGNETNQESMLRAIRRCERDRFKPLANFLKGITNTTDDLNIELLAWLIDFSNRPFKPEAYENESFGKQYKTWDNKVPEDKEIERKMEEPRIVDNEDTNVDKTYGIGLTIEVPKVGGEIPVVNRSAHSNQRQKMVIAIISVLLLLILAGLYFARNRETTFGIVNNGQQKCMMWVGDHYVPTSCEPRREDTLVVAFDIKRVNNFKRITQTDTITILSIGRVWYIRRNGQIEYYTAGGRHPIEPDRMLKPLTKYMIEKHLNALE